MRVTERMHATLAERLVPGDLVIDATAGNGHDTRFLAERVGPTGIVFAIDIQPVAIDRSRVLLSIMPELPIHWIIGDHAHLATLIPPEHHGHIAAIMFNLGYLPCGDHSIITTKATTIPAIAAAWAMLRPGGTLAITVYPGHPGGDIEAVAVDNWISAIDGDAVWHESAAPTGPRGVVIAQPRL
jgi:predicted methyltransferase